MFRFKHVGATKAPRFASDFLSEHLFAGLPARPADFVLPRETRPETFEQPAHQPTGSPNDCRDLPSGKALIDALDQGTSPDICQDVSN